MAPDQVGLALPGFQEARTFAISCFMGSVSESYLWTGRAPGSFISASFTQGRLTMKMNMGVN